MFVLVLVAVYYVDGGDPPVALVTKPTLQHYISKEACQADGKKQVIQFTSEVPKAPIAFAAKCVEITGPAGKPA